MLPTIQRILYATDLGEHTRPVFHFALSLAKQYQAKITMLHTLEPLGTTGMALLESYIPHEKAEQIHQNAIADVKRQMQQRAGEFCQEELGESIEDSELINDVVVAEGHSAQTIVDYAKQHDMQLIVMGTHTYSRFSEMMLGSTARKVTQLSSIPVLIVPMNASKTL